MFLEQICLQRKDTNFAPLDLLEKVSGKLNFICVSSDDLIHLQDRLEIKKDLKNLFLQKRDLFLLKLKVLIMALCARKENPSIRMLH